MTNQIFNTSKLKVQMTDTKSFSNESHLSCKDSKSMDSEEYNEFGEKLPKGIILWSCCFALALANFVAALDVMIVTTIIDEVGEVFKSYSKTGWIMAGYSLPNAVFSLLWGRLAEHIFGFKFAMILSIIVFEIGSLICALATSMNMLIGGRVIAGIGGSGIQSLSFVIGSTLVSMKGRGFIMAFMGISFCIASVVGPFLGGAFTTHVTWRWCFYINLPIGGVALLIFFWFYRPKGGKILISISGPLHQVKEYVKYTTLGGVINDIVFRFDIIEFILSSAGLVCLLLGLTFGGNTYPWDCYIVVILLVFGPVLIVISLVYDFWIFPSLPTVRKDPIKFQPCISWHNMKNPSIFCSSMVLLFFSIGFMSQVAYLVQFFQLVYNQSSWKASIHLITLMVSTVLTSIVCGGIIKKTGLVKPILVFSTMCGVIGSGILTLLDNHSSSSEHIGLLILPGIAFGCIMQCTIMACQLELDKKSPTFRSDFVSVTTFNAFLKNCGPAVGGVISNSVFSGSFLRNIRGTQLGDQISSINDFLVYWVSHFDGSNSKITGIISSSIKDVFYMALGWCAVAFIFSLFISSKRIMEPTKVNEEETP